MELNWQRHYRITFGIPEYSNEQYLTSGSLLASTVKSSENPTQSTPSQALMISNIPEDGNSLRGFNFSFTSKREMSKTSSSKEMSKLTISNLSPEMYELFNTEGCLVKIEAGYRDTGVFRVYQGFVNTVTPQRRGNDVDYIISMREANLDVKNAKVSVDFPETDDAEKVLQALVKFLPSVGSQEILLEKLKNQFVSGGFSFEGSLMDSIENMCRSYGVRYSIYNGKFTARDENLTQGSADYQRIAPNTFVLTPDNVKSFDLISDNRQKLSKEQRVKPDVKVDLFLTNINFDNFFTITEELDEKAVGTYEIKHIIIKLNSRTNVFDTSLRGSPM